MTVGQRTLDGRELERNAPHRPLGEHQRAVLALLRARREVAPADVDPGGWEVLQRLVRRGLAERRAKGRYVLRDQSEDW